MEARDRDKLHKKRYSVAPDTCVHSSGRDQFCAADRPRLWTAVGDPRVLTYNVSGVTPIILIEEGRNSEGR
jgi:hypothetical protein